MKLHLYFARRFLLSFGAVFMIFVGILVLFDLIEQIRRFPEVSFLGKLGLTLLHIPDSLYTILPLIVILATLALFLSLARTSELVVTRAAGRSALRSLMSPVIVALLIGVLAVTAFNPIVAATQKQYEIVSERLQSGGASVLSISREGLWLRQGDADGQTVIRAARANLDGTELYDVSFLGFAPEGGPSFRIEAGAARLEAGAWQLRDVKRWELDSDNPEREATEQDTMTLPSNLTRSQILESFGTPSAIPIWELPRFIAQLEQAGFSARQHRVWLHMELAQPLLLAAMVLVGAGFTMRHTRFGRTGLMVLLALVMGFSLYFVRSLAQILGETGQIPILLAAWGPPIAAMLLPLGLLLHWEDG
ncbi:LPS export ABC transporter permease LptG [Tranquillimonas alkanivorans]|uniref:Lipopolysaccharide export system permease protein n=1 Tax=Tranquillimonas alkanivorans TaxID=441119 RepID=A0A1I5QM87_9RHOB|nr:LPS export ABC transporter permease LptG [Tranquillimonas alkanivorans]SFP47190.1 lipopolysaccharide export system permease protein [Tranquillimonas alkanivorans]